MRKLTADTIFTLDGLPIDRGVIILDDKGKVLEVLTSQEGLEDVEVYRGVLCPGFINAHGHLELSHLRAKIQRGRGLVNFILDVQAYRNMEAEVIQEALLRAEEELLQQGVVGMGDISNSSDSFLMKSASKITYHTFLECFGFQPVRAKAVVEHALSLKKQLQGRGSISPHAPYSVSEKLFKEISSVEPGLLSIHNQESQAENEFYKQGTGDFIRLYETFGIPIDFFRAYGKNSLQTYLPWLANQKKLLVHNTFSSAEDLKKLPHRDKITLCLCPRANLYIEERLPDVVMLMKCGLDLVIGTDSLASNEGLSMLAEMSVIQTVLPEVTLETLLTWACKNAAHFYEWAHLGTITKGKRPGIVQIDALEAGYRIGAGTTSRRIA